MNDLKPEAKVAEATGSPNLQRFIDRGRQRLTLDDRSVEEILGYDENGLPQSPRA